MKQKLLLCIFSFFSLFIYAQTLFPYLGKAGYGFCTPEGKIVVAPQYDEVDFFDESGFANVRKDSLWTFINSKGKELLPFYTEKYKTIEVYNDNQGRHYLKSLRAAYIIDDKPYSKNTYNYFDENRKDKYWIINILSGEARGPFLWNSSSNRLVMAGDYHGALEQVFSFEDNFKTCIYEDGTNVILDTLGNVLLDKNTFQYKDTSQTKQYYSQTMNDSVFIISNKRLDIFERASDRVRLVNLKGKVLYEADYRYFKALTPHSYIGYSDTERYIDFISVKNDGSIQTQKHFGVEVINNNVLKIRASNNKYKLIDEFQHILSNEEFDAIDYENEHKTYRFQKGKFAGILDSNFQTILKYEADAIYSFKIPYFYTFEKKGKSGLMDKNKKIIVPAVFHHVTYFQETNNYVITTNKQNKLVFFSISGKMLIDTLYESIEYEKVGKKVFFKAKNKEKCDLYDENGLFIKSIPMNFHIPKTPLSTEWDYSSGTQKVKIYTQLGEYIGYEGKFAGLKYIQPDSTFICFLGINDSIGLFLNKEGKPILKPNQSILTKLYARDSELYFAVREDQKEGIMDYKLNYILNLDNQKIIEVNDAYFVVKKNNKFYIYDNKGKLKSKEGYDNIEGSYSFGKPRSVFRDIPDKRYWYNPSCCDDDTAAVPILRYYYNVGCIDSLGNEFIPLIYNGVSLIEKEYICLSKGFGNGKKESFILDHKGNILLKTDYDRIDASNRGGSYFIVEKNSKNGLIDIKGNVILPLIYDRRIYEDDNNIYYATENNKRTFINPKGIVLADESEISPISSSGSQLGENYLLPLKTKSLLINKQGEVIFTFKSDKVGMFDDFRYSNKAYDSLLKINQKGKIWYYDYVLNKAYKEPYFEP